MTELAQNRIDDCRKNRRKRLDLSNCSLTTIPLTVCEMTWLEELILTNRKELKESKSGAFYDVELNPNIINYFPKEASRLTNLKRLDISGSKHNSWPVSDIWFLSKLKNIEYLNIGFTNIRTIEPLLPILEKGLKIKNKFRYVHSPNSKGIFLYNNRVVIPNPKIFRDETADIDQFNRTIINFLQRLEALDANRAVEAKLLIIGEPGAGKTSFARKLLDQNSSLPKNNESTKGIDVHSYVFDLKNDNIGRINVWDFAGQEIYYATHKFFLTDRAIYAIVADPRKEDTNFNYWLQIVEKYGGSSKVIIILNEKDDQERDIDTNAIMQRYRNVIGTYKVNFLTGRGLGELLRVIKYQFEEAKINLKGLPENWFSVKKEINKLSSFLPFITLDDYYDLCDKYGVTSIDSKKSLLSHFHDLGILLYYSDNYTLKRTIFLQKQWTTEAVYRIFENNLIRSNGGRFDRDDVKIIWKNSQYSDLYDELLALMIKFELVYSTPDLSKESYLSPQLLPNIEPEINFDPNSEIKIHFKYDFLPKGLLSRLIVRLSRYATETDKVWKLGAFLKRGEAEALIKHLYGSSIIELRVTGNDCKEFMTIISEELDFLNKKYYRLEVEQLIPCNCKDCILSEKPHYYDYKNLKVRLRRNKMTVECELSYIDVEVKPLISDVLIKDFKKYELPDRIRSKVLNLIAHGKVDDVWNELKVIYGRDTELILLMSRWNEINFSNSNNLVSFSQIQVERERIKMAIISWLDSK